MSAPNHPFVVWASCFLWLASFVTIIWALLLLFLMGDVLLITQTDIVIATLLLSGIIMLPTNFYMVYSVASGEKINHKSRVLCCPLWMLISWIILVNSIGVAICIQKVYTCSLNTLNYIEMSMRQYRTVPKYKHFMDNMQWNLKCCGLNSFKDWFRHNWYDRLHDYEWEPHKKVGARDRGAAVADSVPLSCCKSGTCVPNYLLELGTNSIHTNGCGTRLYRAFMISMNVHLIIFVIIVIIEIAVLSCVVGKADSPRSVSITGNKNKMDVRQLIPVNDKFKCSSSSSSCRPEESDFEA